MVMYDNNMIMSLKQKKRKFELGIKLNHNICIIDQAWGQDGWILAKIFNDFNENAKIKRGQYSATLTEKASTGK